MTSNLKLLLEMYKKNKKQFLKFKMYLFMIINIILFVSIIVELNNPILFNKINIQSNLLEKSVSIFNPIFNYMGLNLIQCKVLIIFIFIVILNIIILYFSVVLFVGFLIYLAKLWYKIQTNILINHENMQILDIKLEYLLSEQEKKNILDIYILNNDIKIDIQMYNEILNSIMCLNDKKAIYSEIKNQITDYLIKIHLEAQTATVGNSIVDFTTFLNKLDTVGIIKGIVIVGVIVLSIYFVHSLYTSSIDSSKNMSEVVLEVNKTDTISNIKNLEDIGKKMMELNDSHNKMHRYTLDIEKNIEQRLNVVDQDIVEIKNVLVKTIDWNQKVTDGLNFLGKNVENIEKTNDESILIIKDEIKKIIIEDFITAQAIIELKNSIQKSQYQIDVFLRMINYFHSYIIHSERSNILVTYLDNSNEENEDVD